jgi:hypothetical protein
MAYKGDKFCKGWGYKHNLTMISDIDITYELVCVNVGGLIKARNQTL